MKTKFQNFSYTSFVRIDQIFRQKYHVGCAKIRSTSEVILLDRSVVKVEGRAET